jgi:predicted nucleic acid-binding protein
MYLVDTNVLCELRKRARTDRNVSAWAGSVAQVTLSMSVVTALELEVGVLLMERRDRFQGAALRTWLNDQIGPAFVGRILPVDTSVAVQAARLHVPDRRSDRDAFIAATALVHGLTLVTRNVGDFAGTGVAVLNPWV